MHLEIGGPLPDPDSPAPVTVNNPGFPPSSAKSQLCDLGHDFFLLLHDSVFSTVKSEDIHTSQVCCEVPKREHAPHQEHGAWLLMRRLPVLACAKQPKCTAQGLSFFARTMNNETEQ